MSLSYGPINPQEFNSMIMDLLTEANSDIIPLCVEPPASEENNYLFDREKMEFEGTLRCQGVDSLVHFKIYKEKPESEDWMYEYCL